MIDFSPTRRRVTTLRVSGRHRFGSSVRIRRGASKPVRYAVVGLGYIAQIAVLPAFRHARRNSKLVALISDDPVKRKELARRYRVSQVASYDDYDTFLRDNEIDAVYIALPNSMHRDFSVRAAKAGVHVLCEKPLALSESECHQMIDACKRNRVKLMTAYRLHFERANLEAIKVLRTSQIGELRYFNSIFSMQAREPNIRLKRDLGGGPLRDLGVYCLNAARYLFREEPIEVFGLTASGADKRFREVEEMVGATLRFPGERLASFICSFGAADAASYEVVGTRGSVRLESAYEYSERIAMQISVDGRKRLRQFQKRDQFAPELLYFSDCILRDKEPEPSGEEGLADVRVIEALYRSAKTGKAVKIEPMGKRDRPSLRQEIQRQAVSKPELIHARPAHR